MTNTTLHLALGVGWLFGIPLLAIAMVASGLVPEGSSTFSAVASILWALGLISVFGSWALKDAPVHGKSRYVAATFTLMWLLLPVIAVFPYLFTTRGARQGLLALRISAIVTAHFGDRDRRPGGVDRDRSGIVTARFGDRDRRDAGRCCVGFEV